MDETDIQKALDELEQARRVESLDDNHYRLTDQGESCAIELMGGRDVSNLCAAMLELLRQKGLLIYDPEEIEPELLSEPWTYFVIQRCMHLAAHFFRTAPNWQTFVEQMEDTFLRPAGYFERGFSPAYLHLKEDQD